MKEEEPEITVEQLYLKAKEAFKSKSWEQARDLFLKVKEKSSEYKSVDLYLEVCEEELQQQ